MPIYTKLKDKWKTVLIGNTTTENLTQYEKKVIQDLDRCVAGYLETLNTNINRTYLWKDEADFTQSQKQTNNYRRIYELSKAYTVEGSLYYKNQALLEVIQETLRFLYHSNYNTSHTYYYGNWWNWEIGTPITLLNIMTLLGDDLEEKERLNYCEVIHYYQPNPKCSGERSSNEKIKRRTSVGGNRVDTAKIAILLGIHTKDEKILKKGRDALSDVFEIKKYLPMNIQGEKRDGLYEDWSFIQHGDVAYTGTYGNVLLGGLGELIYLLSGSEWEVTDRGVENIYQMILKSFIPIIYKGHAMDCVNGRGATRQEWQNNKTGHAILSSMLWFCQFAPKEYREKYKRRIKYWLLKDTVRQYLMTNDNPMYIEMAKQILEDDTVAEAEPLVGNFAYAYMDRMIHHTDKFSCALSMSSHRIRTYEPMLGENKKGFYTGDGMLCIYNDQKEYNYDFWATVDPYKLSGTTIVNKEIEDNLGSCRTAAKWVSAMSVDSIYGIAGMQLTKEGVNDETGEYYNPLAIDLVAKKSYFMLENEIVALGSAITSTNDEQVTTTIDTRKVNQEKTNKIETWEKCIYLEGNEYKTSMGYYLFEEQEVNVTLYKRQGTWQSVNENGDNQVKVQNYISLQINHGSRPKDEGYGYVILPGATIEALNSYSQKPTVKVIERSKEIHAIAYKNYTMANFWEAGSLEGIEINQPVSVVIKKAQDLLEITLCDPTKENKNLLVIDFKQQIELLTDHKDYVMKTREDGTSYIEVRWKEQGGKPLQLIVKKSKS